MLLHCIALVIYPSALFFRNASYLLNHVTSIHHDRKASKLDSLVGIRNVIVT